MLNYFLSGREHQFFFFPIHSLPSTRPACPAHRILSKDHIASILIEEKNHEYEAGCSSNALRYRVQCVMT